MGTYGMIENNFSYHTMNKDQQERSASIRESAKMLAHLIVDFSSDSRERSIALTKLEECLFWANAGIARNDSDF